MPRFNEGRALLMWVYACKDKRPLLIEQEAAVFLVELAELIGMTPIAGPFEIKFKPPPERPEDAGVSAALIIEESHLAIHTFPEQTGGSAQITIVSCCDFDQEKARAWILSKFVTAKYFHIDLGGSQGFFIPD